MAEEVAKQEIKETKGSFEFKGIISNFDKKQDYEATTKKNNLMRTLVFSVDTAEGHTHKFQIRAYQGENVYFSKTEVDKDGNRNISVKQVAWNDRQKFNEEGFLPIDRVSYHYGVEDGDSGKRITHHTLTFDAIPEILEEFKVGDSVNIRGNIQIEDYPLHNGDTRTTVRLIPTSIYHTSQEINFDDEKFVEVANFTQKILVDEVEKTGNDEATITGIVIGNQRMGRQDFIFRGDSYKDNVGLFQVLKKEKKYVSLVVFGSLVNSVSQEEEAADEYIEIKGVKIKLQKNPMQRKTGNSFVREFLVTGIGTTKDNVPLIDFGEEYTEENVQEFIDKFIRASKEYGAQTDAGDFVF